MEKFKSYQLHLANKHIIKQACNGSDNQMDQSIDKLVHRLLIQQNETLRTSGNKSEVFEHLDPSVKILELRRYITPRGWRR